MSQPLGHITVAAPVLLALVRAALRETPGVVRLADVPSAQEKTPLFAGPGAAVVIGATGVHVTCAIVAEQGVRLAQVAATARAAVAMALRELAGVDVATVDVSVADVVAVEKTRDHG